MLVKGEQLVERGWGRRKERRLKQEVMREVACREENTRARWVIEWFGKRRGWKSEENGRRGGQ